MSAGKLKTARGYGFWGAVWALVIGGCSSGGSAPDRTVVVGSAPFAAPCQRTEDCATGLCVRVGPEGGVCSTLCKNNAECPQAGNWSCLAGEGLNFQVCACKKSAPHEICADGLDNDCDGKVDDCRLCNGVPAPENDPANCGTCGNACRSDQFCGNGSCQCPANEPADCGACTNLSTDKLNCGACGTTCSSAQECRAGACACPTTSAPDFCAGAGCVDLRSSLNNCGACGNACTLGQSCQDGLCVCATQPESSFCAGVGCVDRNSDPRNCGGCGVVCSADKTCSGGACVCVPGRSLCGDECVDLQADAANCGACARACPAQQTCQSGSCGCTGAGYAVCDGTCAVLGSDAQHCGTCDHACASGERCSAGACVCDSGLYCGGQCVSTTDVSQCGACGNACGSAQYCSSGVCACSGLGLTGCGQACVNLSSDSSNCGACGNHCPGGQSCSGGGCGCGSGQSYCAASSSCVALATDAANCGSCGKTCSPTQVCNAGVCACPASGQLYCGAAGGCIDTLSDSKNCGACGNSCKTGQVCQSGSCKCPVNGQLYCASSGTCIDTLSNVADCGACDKACPSGTSCSFGSCVCSTAGLSLCGSACANLQTDPKHCGSCSNDCGGGYTCSAGKCACPAPIVGTPVRLTTNGITDTNPSLACDGTHCGLAYATSSDSQTANIRFALLNPDGSVVSDTALTNFAANTGVFMNGSGGQPEGPKLVWSGTEYAVTWVQQSVTTYAQTMFQRLDATGASKGPAISINSAAEGDGETSLAGLAWNKTYKGYGLSWVTGFRRIGADGTLPEPENLLPSDTGDVFHFGSDLGTASDGTWGSLATGVFAGKLSFFNLDGSRTEPFFRTSGGSDFAFWDQLIHDGTTWDALTEYNSVLHLNRVGASASASLVTLPANNFFGEGRMVMARGTLAVAWTSSGGTARTFKLQRFSLPTNLTAVPAAVHPAIDVLATPNITGTFRIALAASGSNGLMAVWADNRWGADELYAAPINLQSCP